MNPACGKLEIDYDEMVVGHRKALKKRGISTLKNSVAFAVHAIIYRVRIIGKHS